MVSTSILRLALAASLLSLSSVTFAQPQQQQSSSSSSSPPNEADTSTGTDKPRAMEARGCYSSSKPLKSEGEAEFQSTGECQRTCAALDMPVMALVDGVTCYCGEELPPKEDKIGKENCNTPCAGYSPQTCGGNGVFEVFSTGTSLNEPKHFKPEKKEEMEKSSKDAAPSVVTEVIVSSPAADVAQSDIPDVEEDSDDEGGTGVSTAAIAAGSVAGVLGISSLVGGVFLLLRYRKRREAEEAYKNAVSVNGFIEDGKRPPYSSGSGSDSRLDPVAAQRRMSDGSIADNEDYSRRILQVRNPDSLH